jgi:CRP-like cAMP-binding protein
MSEALVEEAALTKRKSLAIAEGLHLPLELVTETFAIVAKRRVGKSYTARRIAEQLFRADLQIVVVDPKGDWWGIRSDADGKGPGLPILILGGEHGDVPLEAGSGELVAKLVVEERVSLLLDLSLFRKSEVATFMTAFGETLYRLKAREEFRSPVMLLLDEADAVAPQKPQHGEERMLGAVEDIVRRGGQRGIGCGLITQRSAVLNKNVLTQSQLLIALRTIAPQDLKAMDAWIDVHGTTEQRAMLMESLPSLPRGDAWFWSPGWPTDEGLFKRVHVLPIETFDSGATPKAGEKRVEPKKRADVDVEALRRQMAETIERKKATDPKLLQARIRELEAQLGKAAKANASNAPQMHQPREKRVEVPILKDGHVARLEALAVKAAKASEDLRTAASDALAAVNRANATPAIAASGARHPANPGTSIRVAVRGTETRVTPPAPAANGSADGPLGRGEMRVLTAVAQHPDGVTREQLTVLTGYTRSSRNTYIQRLRAAGLVDDGDRVRVTQAGVDALGPNFEPLPTGPELREYVMRTLPQGERVILEQLVNVFPAAVDRETLSEHTGYTRSSRNTYLQRLRARELITEPGSGLVRASETLFA